MCPAVIEVKTLDDYLLTLVFENGEQGQLDLKPMLNFGVFNRLKDYEAFKKVRIAFDSIEWECGVDLDPEFIYGHCVK